MKIRPRPFQTAAINKALGHLEAGKSVCLVSPTGSGKTVMAQAIAATYRQTLCVVHTRALLRQATQRLGRTHTIQQLLSSGMPAGATRPKLVIWDECHHSASDEWQKLAKLFPRARLLGLTATPQRADGLGLDLFDEMVVAANYSYLVEQGFLVKPRVFIPEEAVRGSDPDPVSAYRKYADGSRALFFVRSIEHAEAVVRRLGKGFAPWHCELPWRKRNADLKAFSEGKLRGLVTVDALTEGFDVPSVETIVLGRRCEHVGTYLQIVGRGLRVAPGKDSMVLLDLSGASLRHGSPIADRSYMIGGVGITGPTSEITPERQAPSRRERGQHEAQLIEVFDWSKASRKQRQKAKARLEALAEKRRFSPEVVAAAERRLWGG